MARSTLVWLAVACCLLGALPARAADADDGAAAGGDQQALNTETVSTLLKYFVAHKAKAAILAYEGLFLYGNAKKMEGQVFGGDANKNVEPDAMRNPRLFYQELYSVASLFVNILSHLVAKLKHTASEVKRTPALPFADVCGTIAGELNQRENIIAVESAHQASRLSSLQAVFVSMLGASSDDSTFPALKTVPDTTETGLMLQTYANSEKYWDKMDMTSKMNAFTGVTMSMCIHRGQEYVKCAGKCGDTDCLQQCQDVLKLDKVARWEDYSFYGDGKAKNPEQDKQLERMVQDEMDNKAKKPDYDAILEGIIGKLQSEFPYYQFAAKDIPPYEVRAILDEGVGPAAPAQPSADSDADDDAGSDSPSSPSPSPPADPAQDDAGEEDSSAAQEAIKSHQVSMESLNKERQAELDQVKQKYDGKFDALGKDHKDKLGSMLKKKASQDQAMAIVDQITAAMKNIQITPPAAPTALFNQLDQMVVEAMQGLVGKKVQGEEKDKAPAGAPPPAPAAAGPKPAAAAKKMVVGGAGGVTATVVPGKPAPGPTESGAETTAVTKQVRRAMEQVEKEEIDLFMKAIDAQMSDFEATISKIELRGDDDDLLHEECPDGDIFTKEELGSFKDPKDSVQAISTAVRVLRNHGEVAFREVAKYNSAERRRYLEAQKFFAGTLHKGKVAIDKEGDKKNHGKAAADLKDSIGKFKTTFFEKIVKTQRDAMAGYRQMLASSGPSSGAKPKALVYACRMKKITLAMRALQKIMPALGLQFNQLIEVVTMYFEAPKDPYCLNFGTPRFGDDAMALCANGGAGGEPAAAAGTEKAGGKPAAPAAAPAQGGAGEEAAAATAHADKAAAAEAHAGTSGADEAAGKPPAVVAKVTPAGDESADGLDQELPAGNPAAPAAAHVEEAAGPEAGADKAATRMDLHEVERRSDGSRRIRSRLHLRPSRH